MKFIKQQGIEMEEPGSLVTEYACEPLKTGRTHRRMVE